MSDDLLTTAEAARLAGVGASSVKRWADLELIPCVRTAGGHRRFQREALTRFLRQHAAALVGSSTEWADTLLTSRAFELQGELLRARERLGAWYRVAEEVAGGLVELGARWERGEVSVLEEHVASERLNRALDRSIEALPSGPTDPQALLAAAPGDEHTLGLSLAELCLREAGFACTWAGRGTPTSDLLALVESDRVALLVLSASPYSTDRERLQAEVDALAPACREHGVELLLGGSGAWPEPPSYGTRVRSLSALHDLAVSSRARLAHAP